ncbi:MAG: Gfo/Idh/MocA family oxidoreductase [Clostridia bacterium]|nr:Gfo/Idh/MocA family oxidoreductase [Clostridia bacterium]
MNLGILGAGKIAVIMANTVNRMAAAGNNEVRLCAVAVRDRERAERFAAEFGIPKAFGSYEDMAADDEVDLVYIATPHSHHFEHSMLCLEHGKHVLCEKAFTVNAKQARELIAFAESRGLLITEAIWTRYQPMRRIIDEVVASKEVGEPRMLTANLCYAILENERIVKSALAGGALLDVGVYTINFAEMVFGHADSYYAVCTKNEDGCDMAGSYTMLWKDGRTAVLCSGAEVISDRFGTVFCTEGFIQVENINNPQSVRVFDKNYRLIREIKCPAQLTGYEYEVLETAKAIEEGKTECQSMPHSETVRIMEIMDGMREQMGIKYPFE